MCASDDQQNLEDHQQAFYDDLRKQDATAFGQNQQILQQLQSTYSPILAKGPDQYGFSPDEENDLKTQAAESTSRNYTAAAKTLRENQAALGGGDSYLPSGVETQQSADLLAAGAHDLSDKQLQIKEAGYEKGYDEFNRAGGALAGTAGLWNPTAYAGAATGAGSAAGETANQITQANSSWEAPLLGAAGAVGAAALTPKPPGCWIAEAIYGVSDPRTHTVRAYLNGRFRETLRGDVTMRLYLAIGRPVAWCVRRSSLLRDVFRPMFDMALKSATKGK